RNAREQEGECGTDRGKGGEPAESREGHSVLLLGRSTTLVMRGGWFLRLGLDAGALAVELVERLADLAEPPNEDRGIALCVAACLGVAEGQHQMHEVGRLLALEGGHELLVVYPERVRRVVDDRRELVPDPHVLVHRALPVLVRERVPGTQLHER